MFDISIHDSRYNIVGDTLEHLGHENFQWSFPTSISVYSGIFFSEFDVGYFMSRIFIQAVNDMMPTIIMMEMLKTSGNLMGLMTAVSMMAHVPSMMDAMLCLSIIDIMYSNIPSMERFYRQINSPNYQNFFRDIEDSTDFYEQHRNLVLLRRILIALYIWQFTNKTYEDFRACFNFASLFSLYHVIVPTQHTYYSFGTCLYFYSGDNGVFSLQTNTFTIGYFSVPITTLDYNIHKYLTKSIYNYSSYTDKNIDKFNYTIASRIIYIYQYNNIDAYKTMVEDMASSDDPLRNKMFKIKLSENSYKYLSFNDLLHGITVYNNSNLDSNDLLCVGLVNKMLLLSNTLCKAVIDVIGSFQHNGSPLSNTTLTKFKTTPNVVFNHIDVDFLIEDKFWNSGSVAYNVFNTESVGDDKWFMLLNLLVIDFVYLKQTHLWSYFSVDKLFSSDVCIQYIYGLYNLLINIQYVVNWCIYSKSQLDYNININIFYSELCNVFNYDCSELNTNNISDNELQNYKKYIDNFINPFIGLLTNMNPFLKMTYEDKFY